MILYVNRKIKLPDGTDFCQTLRITGVTYYFEADKNEKEVSE
jgi:hypothetical protein